MMPNEITEYINNFSAASLEDLISEQNRLVKELSNMVINTDVAVKLSIIKKFLAERENE